MWLPRTKDSMVKNQAFLRRNQAYAALREFEDKSIEEFRELVLFAQKWAMAKTVNRSGWAQALLHIVSGGKGRGALLFQTFAQELVDSLVEKTGGRPVVIEVPELPDGEVTIEQGDDKASHLLVRRRSQDASDGVDLGGRCDHGWTPDHGSPPLPSKIGSRRSPGRQASVYRNPPTPGCESFSNCVKTLPRDASPGPLGFLKPKGEPMARFLSLAAIVFSVSSVASSFSLCPED